MINQLNPDIAVAGEYTTEKSRLNCVCKICGHQWAPTAHDLKRCPRCPACSFRTMGLRGRASVDSLQERIAEVQPNLVLIGEYHGVHKKMDCKCIACGTVFAAHPSNLYTGNTGCPVCRMEEKIQKLRHNHDDIVKLISSVRPDVTVLGQYTRMKDKLRCYCADHDYEYEQSVDKILLGQRGCRYCANQSSGERKLASILDAHDILFVAQHVFSDCSFQAPLRFDAYLPAHNIAIEYDGEGHYRPIDFSGKGIEWANQQLKLAQMRDAIKDAYCETNNITLIRIPYWEYDNMEHFLLSKIQSQTGVSSKFIS